MVSLEEAGGIDVFEDGEEFSHGLRVAEECCGHKGVRAVCLSCDDTLRIDAGKNG